MHLLGIYTPWNAQRVCTLFLLKKALQSLRCPRPTQQLTDQCQGLDANNFVV